MEDRVFSLVLGTERSHKTNTHRNKKRRDEGRKESNKYFISVRNSGEVLVFNTREYKVDIKYSVGNYNEK